MTAPRLGKHQLRLLITLASPGTRMVVADAVSASLERVGLVKAHSPAAPAKPPAKAIPAGMVGITPAGLRRLADELEAGRLDQFFKFPAKGTRPEPQRSATRKVEKIVPRRRET